jgi:polysaccharide pyruvyl transferase WcaK-like protein
MIGCAREMNVNREKIFFIADITGMAKNYHIGDEAMAIVAWKRLTHFVKPQNIVIACCSPHSAALTYNVEAIELLYLTNKQLLIKFLKHPVKIFEKLLNIFMKVNEAQVVFISGGGNMNSIWEEALEQRLFVIWVANILRKPVVLVSQTFGPFSLKHRRNCQKILSKCKWLGVRDRDFSQQQLGLDVKVAPDDAVFLEAKHNEVTNKIVDDNQQDVVGISFHIHPGLKIENMDGLLTATAEVIKDLQCKKVVFVPHQTIDSLVMTDGLAPKIDDSRTKLILTPPLSAEETRAITGSFTLVLATRYHAVIFALAAGIPVIGVYSDLYTEAKLRGAFEMFNLDPYILNITNVNKTSLSLLVEEALNNRRKFAESASWMKNQQFEISMAPYHLVRDILTGAINT